MRRDRAVHQEPIQLVPFGRDAEVPGALRFRDQDAVETAAIEFHGRDIVEHRGAVHNSAQRRQFVPDRPEQRLDLTSLADIASAQVDRGAELADPGNLRPIGWSDLAAAADQYQVPRPGFGEEACDDEAEPGGAAGDQIARVTSDDGRFRIDNFGRCCVACYTEHQLARMSTLGHHAKHLWAARIGSTRVVTGRSSPADSSSMIS